MPFASKAQERWMYATQPKMAKRWNAETGQNKNLPDHVVKKAKAAALRKLAGQS